MKSKDKTNQKAKSIQIKLFFSLCIVIIATIVFLIIINNIVLETFYVYKKRDTVKNIYEQINERYNKDEPAQEILEYVKEQSSKNNVKIYIRNPADNEVITNNKNRNVYPEALKFNINIKENGSWGDTLYKSKNAIIKVIKDSTSDRNFIVLVANLDNGNELSIRTPVSAIKDSLRLSNQVLILVGGISVLISAVIASIVSKRFSNPILELSSIAKKVSNLDFSQKYIPSDSNDELDQLGTSINMMSEKLEHTIKELKENNNDLERDIKEKSKIDEMRTQFISDVSHELKTPIALIQGYSEGLIENINDDEESRKFYAEVILDEANKMDKLVKQLLELMKLEYGKREFNNSRFDIVALTKEVIKNCDLMVQEQNIELTFANELPIYVYADDFYIEQVITNYLTNAIKYAGDIDGKKSIVINIIENPNEFVRVSVYNTGKHFSDDEMKAIWGRFYKIDASRNREDGGTGIGLSLVKAIMNNYQNKYGVKNRENGVEFYFELQKDKMGN